MAQLLTVRLNKSDQQPLGFRLQGGKDFGTPLVVQKVNLGSPAERAGLQAGDALIKVNATEVYTLRHQDAQDAIRAAGPALELTVQRGGSTWKPSVTPTGSLPRPGSRPLGASPAPVTSTSLKANPQPNRAFGSGHNNVAKPFGYTNGTSEPVKGVVNKQYNTPVNMYSEQSIAETLAAQTEVLAGGVLGVNFKKNEKTYDAEKSAVFKVLQEEAKDPEPEAVTPGPGIAGLRSVTAPVSQPQPINNTGGLPPGQNICEECERLITGVFVRIKDKNLHVECFKCATCGSSLKNQGYYNLNGKLYCDIHAKLIARQNPPSANLEPVTVPPGGRILTNAYSSPLPPLSTTNYSNGSSSMFSPSSNLSGPKPFGSSIGSAYSPSLSPRSAPLSPRAPAHTPAAPAYTPAAPAYTPAAPTYTPAAPAYTPAAPAYAPAAPPTFAPTNDHHNTSTLTRQEFKSPAEERLIRKMAKMALNGYEIGIQRKIKPADKIQSMADKIQDTVVTKHPLNASERSLEDNSWDNTLTRSTIKSDRNVKPADNIISIGDKIRETIMNNHPASNSFLHGSIPPPPPIPNSPIPTFNVHSTPLPNMNGSFKRNAFSESRENSPKQSIDQPIISNGLKHEHEWSSSGHSSSEDINKENKSNNSFTNTLKKNNVFEKTSQNGISTPKTEFKVNGNSNTLNKKKLFENCNNSFNDTNGHNTLNGKRNINGKDSILSEKKSIFEKKSDDETETKTGNNQSNTNGLPKTLYDNSFYSPRKTNGFGDTNGNHNGQNTSDHESKEAEETETVVRRREKKNKKNDGRRDSHIVTRPMSTLDSVDITDGQYICNVCEEAITRGPFITALGRIWCPEHFTCVNASCRRQLQDIGFVEENGQLYCEYCFEQYIAPACDKCHAKIKGDCLNAIGKHFHPSCFACVYCGKLFNNNPFFLEDGLPYCEADWNELFTTKCFACGFPVEAGDRWVEALNNNYHSQCFNCTVCKKNLEGQSFFAKGGRPFCKMHAR